MSEKNPNFHQVGVDRDLVPAIREIARREHRSLSGQISYMLRGVLEEQGALATTMQRG